MSAFAFPKGGGGGCGGDGKGNGCHFRLRRSGRYIAHYYQKARWQLIVFVTRGTGLEVRTAMLCTAIDQGLRNMPPKESRDLNSHQEWAVIGL